MNFKWHFAVVQESQIVQSFPQYLIASCTKRKIANYMAAENLVSSEMLLLDAIRIARMTIMQKSRGFLLTVAKRICHFRSTDRIPVQ